MILVISSKNVYAMNRLNAESRRMEVALEVMDIKDLAKKSFKVNLKKYRSLYIRSPYVNSQAKFLRQIIQLAKKFKAAGKRVVDAAIANGKLGLGKMADYTELKKAGLPIPWTKPYQLPPTTYPLILKWIYGFGGKHTFFIENQKDFKQAINKYPKSELLVQEFIPAEFEYKIMTVGYKALPVILKFAIHPQTHRPDFEKFKVIKVGKQVSPKIAKLILLAEKASRVLKRELAKVDILELAGKFYILEVNRFPGLDSFEILTKYNVAREFVKYLQKP